MEKIKIEVAYATLEKQCIRVLEVECGCTIEEAISQSGIKKIFPEIDLTQHAVGIFGEVRGLQDRLKENDRVEIYRKLVIDPKEGRRLRVKKKNR